jgi:pilus assembly protein Flp/PilA
LIFAAGVVASGSKGGKAMFALLRKFRRDQSGATAIEYALIVALISVVAIGAYRTIGTNLNTNMGTVGTALQ